MPASAEIYLQRILGVLMAMQSIASNATVQTVQENPVSSIVSKGNIIVETEKVGKIDRTTIIFDIRLDLGYEVSDENSL